MPAEKVEVALTTWDYILRVWAVLGPLIAGSASALWARRNVVNDREYLDKKAIEKEKRVIEEQKLIRQEIAKKEKYQELKDACVEFMTSSHYYVRKQSEYLTNSTPELHDHAREANDQFTSSNQRLVLLGNDELSAESITFWNATIATPKSYKIGMSDDYNKKLAEYQSSRTKFNAENISIKKLSKKKKEL